MLKEPASWNTITNMAKYESIYDQRRRARVLLVRFNFVINRLRLARWIELNDMEGFSERVVPIA